jgi:hypothetical protein
VQVIIEKGPDSKPNKIYFRFAKVFFGISLIAQEFPLISRALEAAKKIKGAEFKVKFDDLRKAVARATPFSDTGLVKLSISGNKLALSAKGTGSGTFQTNLEGSDPSQKVEGTFSINVRYLAPVIARNYGDSLVIGLTTDGSKVWLLDRDDPNHNVTYYAGCIQNQ